MSGPRTSVGNPSRTRKGKGASTSSQIAKTHWPRDEGQRFDLSNSNLPLDSDEEWDQNDAYYYNNWLDITIEPTRFMCGQTLTGLGLLYDVNSILDTCQLSDLVTQPDDLYPDLVRQCLASAKLTYSNPRKPVASQGALSFFAGGKRYEVTISDICALYGFDPMEERVASPTRLPVAHEFWDFIARGDYFSRSAAQSTIRNPALRIGVKAISTIFFAREDASKVRNDELIMLFNTVRNAIGNEPGLSCEFDGSVNMGALFASCIADKRTKMAKGKAASHCERIGSLLTRLFTFVKINLATYTCNSTTEFMDTSYLISCEILADTNIYRFTARDKTTMFCRLPQPALTDLEVAANVGFTPGTEYLCTATGAPVERAPAARAPKPRRSTSSTRPAPAPAPTMIPDDAPLSQEEEEDLAAATQRTRQSRAHYRMPYASELTLDDISDAPEDPEYRRWMVASTKKNNGLLRRILHMLQKGCSSSQATETIPSTAPASPPVSRPSTSARPSTRSSKRKKPITSEDSDDTTSD